ncbi:hypothetical protein GCM10012280_39930 [Wenjunlia tyrosinilytica]|uniref:Uncharacterized protein n=1 Tax=Wenjunlia tyrosinilytica TaxID=1544741 RepID=A0A918DZJ1_9ACTN|nr:hypothetical protein GCM10012280_39930 [Wenjunlia tyrosinilytica]
MLNRQSADDSWRTVTGPWVMELMERPGAVRAIHRAFTERTDACSARTGGRRERAAAGLR